NVDLRTLTVSFPDERFSELKYATSTAKRINAKAEVIHLDDTKVLELVFAALEAADQPTVDGVNSYIVARAAHLAGIRVLLTGLGGDEIFGGYTTFTRAPALARHNLALPLMARMGRRMFANPESWPKWHKLGQFYDVGNVRDAYLLHRSISWRGLPFGHTRDLPPAKFWVPPETMQELANAHDENDFLQIAFLESSFY